jgi:curli biogenesis system outer membrane secretion channel CsgG
MKIETNRNVLFLLIAGILLSCAPSQGHLDLARATSKPGLDMYNARLGILPLRSYPADIGSVISVIIGKELRDTGIEITETAEMIRILREQNISPRTVTKGSDYQMIGRVCNVDYLLVGKAVVSTYSKKLVRTGVVSVDFLQTTAEIVDTTTGEVVLSAGVQRPPKKKWHQSDIIGQALATAIKKELTKYSQP